MIRTENKHFIYDRPVRTDIKYLIKSGIMLTETVFYSVLSMFVHPVKRTDKKYNVTICGIFKDEAPYLKEWIEFHLIAGVDHFYLYNNLSSDHYMEVLQEYIERGVVDLIDWPMPQTQLKAYADCISRFQNEAKWIGFIDIDEFVVPVKKNDIYSLLEKYETKFPAVIIYWKLFGSSGKIDRFVSGLVTEDFIQCWEKYDEVGKCFFNTNYTLDPQHKRCHVFHHFLWAKYKGISMPPANCMGKICVRPNVHRVSTDVFPIQINHYFTKSYEEYTMKKRKGDVFYKENPHESDEYFYRHDMLCQTADYRIFKYMIKLKKAMNIEH